MKHETHTLQLWPSGDGYQYRGSPDGPRGAKRLRRHFFNGKPHKWWRRGTEAEWAAILAEVRVERYIDRDVLKCDSMLVCDLLQLQSEGIIDSEWSYDSMTGLYPDPSEWDAKQCQEWLDDLGISYGSRDKYNHVIVAGGPSMETVNTWSGRQCLIWLDANVKPEHVEADYRDDVTRFVEPLRALVNRFSPIAVTADHADECWLDDLKQAVTDNAEPAEIYEWWAITEWLAGQLTAIGEPVLDNAYGYWWGRTCTGQAIKMDGTLQQIARRSE